jgi:hypothetical protein
MTPTNPHQALADLATSLPHVHKAGSLRCDLNREQARPINAEADRQLNRELDGGGIDALRKIDFTDEENR